MKILVIEDQADIRDTLRDLLEFNGHQVLAAEDGVQGVQLAAEKPDFIFCDIAMPNLDGPGVLAAVKQMPGVGEVPFVFLTAKAERSDRRAGMALGVDDYITKPFTERDILEAIAARTGRQRSVRERLEQLREGHRRQVHAQWAHELLTPLNAVLGCVLLLEEEADTIARSDLKEILGTIRAGAERQDRLARKLIRYFELEQLREQGRGAAGDGCEAPAAIAAGAERAAKEAQRDADLIVASMPGRLPLYSEYLAGAVYEVTSNAFRFSAPGQEVCVTGTAQAGRYRIEIVDRGPGLPAEQRAHVGAFAQFDRHKREQQGLGLGLAIARCTAVLAGGSLFFAEGPGGRGLAVTFDLPVG